VDINKREKMNTTVLMYILFICKKKLFEVMAFFLQTVLTLYCFSVLTVVAENMNLDQLSLVVICA
jgi:hypothetical protein